MNIKEHFETTLADLRSAPRAERESGVARSNAISDLVDAVEDQRDSHCITACEAEDLFAKIELAEEKAFHPSVHQHDRHAVFLRQLEGIINTLP